MPKIIGSIDNAFILNTAYHLVFTEKKMIALLIKKGKEERREMMYAQMSNPTAMVPDYGDVSSYKATRNALMDIIGENITIGMDVEKNIDGLLREEPPKYKYTSTDYTEVENAELSGGRVFSLPHIIVGTHDTKT